MDEKDQVLDILLDLCSHCRITRGASLRLKSPVSIVAGPLIHGGWRCLDRVAWSLMTEAGFVCCDGHFK
jgi:hypothetical protein